MWLNSSWSLWVLASYPFPSRLSTALRLFLHLSEKPFALWSLPWLLLLREQRLRKVSWVIVEKGIEENEKMVCCMYGNCLYATNGKNKHSHNTYFHFIMSFAILPYLDNFLKLLQYLNISLLISSNILSI